MLGFMQKKNLRQVFLRSIIRRKHTLPLLDTSQLISQGLPRLDAEATVPLRDFIEWVNIENSRTRSFFTHRARCRPQPLPSLSLFEPILSHCLARWLLVDYNLNSYPYYDLNIVIIYTDLQQSLRIARNILKFFEKTSSEDLYQRVNCILVPLYDETRNIALPDSNIKILKQGALSVNSTFFIEDPVYVLMINDILRYLSHDYILKSDTQWEQCYVDLQPGGKRVRRFDKKMDYWCQLTYELLKEPLNASNLSDVYIPSRLVQLFLILKHCVPEHKLVAMDLSQQEGSGFRKFLEQMSRRGDLYRPCDIIGPNDTLSTAESTTFISDFTQIRQLYGIINDGMKMCQTETLNDFTKDWMDLEESAQILETENIVIQAEQLATSTISVLHC